MKAITYKTFTLTPSLAIGQFDLSNNEEVFDSKKGTSRMADKFYGYGMSVPNCIKKMIAIEAEANHNDTVTLRQYLDEYVKAKKEMETYLAEIL